MNVHVLGAGVIGLTTAVTLAEHGHCVLVIAAEPPEHTTSWTAGALWGPWFAQPADLARKWAADSLHTLTALADQPTSGVRLVAGKDISTVQHEPPDWFSLLDDVRSCTADELPDGYAHGMRYTAPLVTMPIHLTYLVERLRGAGGSIEHGTVTSLDEAARQVPIVINCTGLGARSLAGDDQLYPVRGQHVVVTNPGIVEFIEVDTGDSAELIAVYPHSDHVVLGGTAEPRVWNRTPDQHAAESILDRCTALVPLLRDAEVLEHRVGLRPSRPEVRLAEEIACSGARIIHNYGHGGAGVSLAWGCAFAVLALLDR